MHLKCETNATPRKLLPNGITHTQCLNLAIIVYNYFHWKLIHNKVYFLDIEFNS